MKPAILLSFFAMAFAMPVAAQETDDARHQRLMAFVEAEGRGGLAMSRRLQMLTREDRAFLRQRATSVVSDYIAVCGPAGPGPNLCERGLATPPGATRPGPVRPNVAAPTAPPQPVLTAEQQDALEVWNELYPRLNANRPDPDPRVWLRYSPEDRTRMVEQCVRLRRAADTLGPPYTSRQPCPHPSHFQGAAETVRRAEIAETERINAARAAARAGAIAGSESGLVSVRTYDRNGNYTGTRLMTPSQAETVGARPQ